MITDWHFYALAIPAVMLLGISKGGFSGVGLVALPMLSLLIPPLQAAAILLPILMVQDIVGIWALRKDYSAVNLKWLTLGGLIGIGIAVALARFVTDNEVLVIVGLIASGFVLHTWLKGGGVDAPPSEGRPAVGVFGGAWAGFTSFIANAGAPPAQVFLTPQKLSPKVYAGTMAFLFGILNYVKFAAFIWLGQVTLPNLQVSILLFPVAIVSILLGVALVRRVKPGPFYRIIYALTFLVGLKLIYDGVTGLMRSGF